MELHRLTVHHLSQLIGNKEISCEELIKAYLEHISREEDRIRAFVTVSKEEAIAQAKALDEQLARGEELPPLAGIPAAIDDNICTKGIRTSCASRMLDNYIPPFEGAVIANLRKNGAIIIAKSNIDEFAMGSSTENSGLFCTRNPFDPEFVPGGAGGGSAAATAAGEAAFALGSDTGGSIRQPAAFCGIIGLKPTYGYVSRAGLISYAPSLDQIGPFTRDMTDLALILKVICGHDRKDSTSACVDVPDFKKSLVNNVGGLRIGLPKDYFGTSPAPQIEEKLKEAAGKLEELGAVCEEVAMPHGKYALSAHYIISSAEASSNMARYDGVRYGLRAEAEDVLSMFRKTRSQGFGAEVKSRIMLGTHVLSAGNYDDYYVKAQKVRTLIKQDFARAFEKYDCLLIPAVPSTAFRIGEKAGDPWVMQQSKAYTVQANLAGLPALSLPFGLADGLPVGLQFIAPHFEEGTLLRIGYTMEQNTDQTRPVLGLSRK